MLDSGVKAKKKKKKKKKHEDDNEWHRCGKFLWQRLIDVYDNITVDIAFK